MTSNWGCVSGCYRHQKCFTMCSPLIFMTFCGGFLWCDFSLSGGDVLLYWLVLAQISTGSVHLAETGDPVCKTWQVSNEISYIYKGGSKKHFWKIQPVPPEKWPYTF